MIWRMAKIGFVATAGVALVGGMLFGSDAISYLSSSAKSMRTAVKGNLPVEVELERARHELDRIIPEMQANIRMIAEDEVEVAELEDDIRRGGTSLGEEQVRIAKLRNIVSTRQAAYTLGGFEYTREQVKQDLARRFDRYKEAEIVLAGKRRLLVTREKALYAAKQMLDRARMAKVQLADQIEALESQHRLVQAASIGSKLETNNTALARTETLIRDIKKRLDVAERVLAVETRFIQPIEVDTISEQELLAEVDAHFSRGHEAEVLDSDTSADDDELAVLSRADQQD